MAADTTSGFLIGLLDRHNYDNLTSCFHGSDTFNQRIEAALDAFVTKTNENILGGVRTIASIMNLMPDHLFDCSEKSIDDATALQTWSDHLNLDEELE